jgi:hypothetical protein
MAAERWINALFGCAVAGMTACAPALASETEGQRQARQETDDPVLFHNQLELKPNYVFHSDSGGWSYSQINRLLHPYDASSVVPGLRIDKGFSLVRVDLPFICQNTARASGCALQDTVILDLAGFHTSFGAVGIGPVVSLPTATSAATGRGKWSIGPAAGLTIRSLRGLRIGLLLQQFFSITGLSTRPSVNELRLQFIFHYYFQDASYLFTDPTYRIDFENGHNTVPVNLQFGKAFSKTLTASVGPEYIASGTARGDLGIRLTLDFHEW